MRHNSSNMHLRLLCTTALFVAVIYVATAFFPKIPIGSTGYAHPGDIFIYFAACVLPFPYAPLAAALGGAFADLSLGYAFYLPFTFAVKFCLALTFTDKGDKILVKRNVIACFICVAITYFGYMIPDTIMTGSIAAAAVAGIMNIVQAAVSAVVFIFFAKIFDHADIKKRTRM